MLEFTAGVLGGKPPVYDSTGVVAFAFQSG